MKGMCSLKELPTRSNVTSTTSLLSTPPQLLNQSEKVTWRHWKVLLISWAGWTFDFYDLILYSFLLIPIGKELHLSNVALGYVLGSSLAATAVGGVIFGVLADKLGRKAILSWTILTYSIGTCLCGFSTGVVSLLIFRIITGIGVGGEWATGQAYIAETFPARMRGRVGALMQTGAPVGIAVAALVNLLQPDIGWRGCFFVSLVPALLVVAVRRSLHESDMWAERQRMKYAGELTRREMEMESRNKLVTLITGTYRKHFLLALVLATLDASAYWFTYSWLPIYLQAERGMGLTRSVLWILVTQAGGTIGYISFGWVADCLGRRPAYSIYGVLWAAGMLMITLFWGVVVAFPAVLLSFMFLVGIGTGMFGGYGPLFAELFPTGIRNTAMGTAFNVARGVQFLTPVIIAVVARSYGLSGGLSLAAFFALACGAWIWTFPETKGKKLHPAEMFTVPAEAPAFKNKGFGAAGGAD
jgi:MFS family permease